jgi:NAD(P)-dependent dehydrogenase (short-subunit alcohol dehydrogenase family)
MDLVEACLADDEAAALDLVSSVDRTQHRRVYAATKIAIARWVRRHAPTPEWARAGIRLNAIAPGATKTQFFGTGADDKPWHEHIPTGAFATPEQIAAWIVMMLGDAAEAMAGSVVYVDGGLDARRRTDAWPAPPIDPSSAERGSGLRRLLRRG